MVVEVKVEVEVEAVVGVGSPTLMHRFLLLPTFTAHYLMTYHWRRWRGPPPYSKSLERPTRSALKY